MQVNKMAGRLSKDYHTPEVCLHRFDENDVIRTSGEDGNEVGIAWSNKWRPSMGQGDDL